MKKQSAQAQEQKVTAKKERLLVGTDNVQLTRHLRKFNNLLPKLNQVLKTFEQIGIGKITSVDDLKKIYHSGPEKYLNDRLVEFAGGESALRLGSATLKREKLAEMLSIESPTPFYHAFGELQSIPSELEYFTVKDDEAILDTDRLNRDLTDQHSKHIEPDTLGAVLNQKTEAACAALNDLRNYIRENAPNLPFNERTFFHDFLTDPSGFSNGGAGRASIFQHKNYIVHPIMQQRLADMKQKI